MRIITLLLLLQLSLFASGSTEDSMNESESTQAIQSIEQEPTFVDVSDVPEKSVKIIVDLKSMQERIDKEKKKTKDMHEAVEPYAHLISLLLENSNYKNISKQNARELQKMQSELAVYLKQLMGWERILKSSIQTYDVYSERLKKYSTLWSQTHSNAVAENTPDAILDNIVSVITDVEVLQNSLKTEYDKTLIDSQIITNKVLTLEELDTQLQETEISIRNKIFYQNKEPLFDLLSENRFSFSTYIENVYTVMAEKNNERIVYFQTHEELFLKFVIVMLLSMVFVLYYNNLYRKRKLFASKESFHKKMFFFIGRPFSTFFIFFMLIITALFPDKPHAVTEMQLIILIVPVIRILQTIVNKEYYKYIYVIFTLFILHLMVKNAMEYELENRIFLFLINIALFATVGVILLKKVLSVLYDNMASKLGSYLLLLSLLFLFVAGAANLYGSVLLSSRLIDGVLVSIYSSMVFYALYTILTGYVVIILRRRISTASNMLDKYSKNIEDTTRLLLKIWMFSWWFLVVVKVVGIHSYLLTFKNDILAFSWQIAEATISVQSVFDFILIVLGTWVLARLIKTILEVEVFARFTFPRGMPTAILTISNYIIIISGTIIAFTSLGVSAQQFALIFGALGVGIGFGLRNIIANFVSGIIMVFERPVQIGDVIEVDKTMGEVQSIGSRASTLKTFDGSEVIIPNADFIAKEITNWTLSDKHRRKVVNFKVDFDSDIEMILEIMKEVALAHPDVLKEPEPLAAFQGFGEYYLEFKLYFWLSSNLIVAPSDVSIGIYKALKEAGITMPVPKRELKREV
ncbi:MAG: hypothetical protein DRG09_05045 [Epsilonproteobacteria bacterium]|nr:MAG: hypothetical protein DRG09_05045 [Campylobacterota bacterium]